MDIANLIPQFGGVIWMIIAFVVALSVIVAIHEYGHYIVGRWCGIKADVFSLGFGPVLASRVDRRGTKWQIAALPFGGYVKFAGDSNAASGKDEAAMAEAAVDPVRLRETMHGAPLWARALTVAAGPVFNFILTFLILTGLGLSAGTAKDPLTISALKPLPVSDFELAPGDSILKVAGVELPGKEATEEQARAFLDAIPETALMDYTVIRDGEEMLVSGPNYSPPLIGRIVPTGAADTIGLLAGDVIVGVDGTKIHSFKELKRVVEASQGRTLLLEVWRDGTVSEFAFAARVVDEPQRDGSYKKAMRIGIAGASPFEPVVVSRGVLEAAYDGLMGVWYIIDRSLSGLGHMIAGKISTCNMSGPIGIAQISGSVASQGALQFIELIAALSTAIGLLNLFPIPALDGGHLVFYAYEAVKGRPPSENALRWLMSVGIALVMSLMLFALLNDVFC